MEEDQYRATYHAINQSRCEFEKAILSRRCNCSAAHRFCLAEREGVTCHSSPGKARCREFLSAVRDKARFVFKLSQTDGPLPHAKEIRVQLGSLSTIVSLIDSLEASDMNDIDTMLEHFTTVYEQPDSLPFDQIIRSIAQTQGRRRRARKKQD
jgi:hypothetical protein